jgi:membrane protease subunit (stomatin/prohibitin family)
VLLRNVVGTNKAFSVEEIGGQLRDLMVARFANAAAESKIPVLDMAANQDQLGNALKDRIKADFEPYGIEVTQLVVENISLPPEVEQAMDKRTSMGVLGNLDQYMKFQAANSLEKAAENPGGSAALGVGFAMANQLGAAMQPATQPAPQQSAAAAPPPLPGSATIAFHVAMDGKQAGPFDIATIQQHVESGKINRATLVWRQGMAAWTPAEKVPELQDVFAAVPPPLPPA